MMMLLLLVVGGGEGPNGVEAVDDEWYDNGGDEWIVTCIVPTVWMRLIYAQCLQRSV